MSTYENHSGLCSAPSHVRTVLTHPKGNAFRGHKLPSYPRGYRTRGDIPTTQERWKTQQRFNITTSSRGFPILFSSQQEQQEQFDFHVQNQEPFLTQVQLFHSRQQSHDHQGLVLETNQAGYATDNSFHQFAPLWNYRTRGWWRASCIMTWSTQFHMVLGGDESSASRSIFA